MTVGRKRLNHMLRFLHAQGLAYSRKREGSTTYITRGKKTQRFVTSERVSVTVMNCCKAVKVQCTRYAEQNGIPAYGQYNNRYFGNISDYILKGGKIIAYVDVKHCYWQIAFIHGLINEPTYLKYKDERQARLTAIGCCQRASVSMDFQGRRFINRNVTTNPLSWVWHFVNYKSHIAMEALRKKFDIFSYHTDGAYLKQEDAQAAKELILKKHKLQTEISYFDVIGYDGYYLVLRDRATKQYKRTHMRFTPEARKKLRKVNGKKMLSKNKS